MDVMEVHGMLCIKMVKFKFIIFIILFIFFVNFFSAISYGEGTYGSGVYGIGGAVSQIPTFTPSQIQIEEGYTKSLYENWKIEFEFENKTHIIKVDKIINKTVVLTVSSVPVTFNLTVNGTKKLDLNDDGFYDLQIFLKNITDYKADLVVKSVYEEIPVEELEGIKKKEKIREIINNFIGIIELHSLWILVGVGSIIIIVVGIIVVLKIVKRKEKISKPITEESLSENQ